MWTDHDTLALLDLWLLFEACERATSRRFQTLDWKAEPANRERQRDAERRYRQTIRGKRVRAAWKKRTKAKRAWPAWSP